MRGHVGSWVDAACFPDLVPDAIRLPEFSRTRIICALTGDIELERDGNSSGCRYLRKGVEIVKRLRDLLIHPEATVYQAIEGIDKGELKLMLVVDSENHLLGSVSDGDVRRAILRSVDLNSPVSGIMNSSPISVPYGISRDDAIAVMRDKQIHCVPVVDERRQVIGLETDSMLLWDGVEDTRVVLMAGGLGMRLRPLTEMMPKPLLPINGKPILEGIIERFVEQGFTQFSISVNYKAEMISDYFGNGSRWGCHIDYLHENKRLGTAGALGLLNRDGLSEHILVMNGDLLTNMDFRQLLDFHKRTDSCASMCVRDYSIQVPYGVVEVEGQSFIGIREKPAHQYYINAGIYAFRSQVLDVIPQDEMVDVTSLFEMLRDAGKSLSVFPMRESWVDIGDIKEYRRANNGHDEVTV